MKKKLDDKTALMLVLVVSIWGTVYAVNKSVLNKMPAFTVIFFRSLVAAITLNILLRAEKTYKRVDKSDYKLFLISGFGGYFLAFALQSYGIKFSTASMSALINSVNPLGISIMSAIFLKEKLTLRKLAGIAVAIGGVYLVLGGTDGNAQVIGVVLSLLSVTCWSYVTTINKTLSSKYSSLQVTAYSVAIAAAFNLFLCLCEILSGQTISVDPSGVAGILFMGVVGTGTAHYLWNRCLSRAEASVCSLFYPLQAVVATLMGILFLDEKLSGGFVVGSFVVIVGIFISLTQPRARAQR